MKKYENPMIEIAVFDKENVVTDSSAGFPDNTAEGAALNHYNVGMGAYVYTVDFNLVF